MFYLKRKVLHYSYKRITTLRPKKLGNKDRKRIAFIQEYFNALDDPDTIIFSIDQAGFGRPIRNYGYSKIG